MRNHLAGGLGQSWRTGSVLHLDSGLSTVFSMMASGRIRLKLHNVITGATLDADQRVLNEVPVAGFDQKAAVGASGRYPVKCTGCGRPAPVFDEPRIGSR